MIFISTEVTKVLKSVTVFSRLTCFWLLSLEVFLVPEHISVKNNRLILSMNADQGWAAGAHAFHIKGDLLFQFIPSMRYTGSTAASQTSFFFCNYLFNFGCAGSLWLCGLFSGCSHQGLLFCCGGHCGFSLWWLLSLQSMGSRCAGLRSYSTWAQ